MSSPPNNTDPMAPASLPETPAVLDAAMNDIMGELENLTTPVAALTLAAQQCYNDRLEYDSQCEKFNAPDQAREQKRAAAEDRLEMIRDQVAEIKQSRQAILSQVPPHLLTQFRTVADSALCELETVLLQTEQQKLASTLATVDLAMNEFALAQVDLLGVQDAVARMEVKNALDTVEDALWNLKDVFGHYGGDRIRAIDRELLHLHNPRRWEDAVNPSPASYPMTNGVHDETDSTMSPPMSPLDLGPSVVEELGELNLNTHEGFFQDLPFQFLPFSSPTLLRLALWLGLSGSVEAAILLNAQPIQNAFATYRAPAGESCAEDPERLKLVLPLFTYSRESLLNWRRSSLSRTNSSATGLDLSAAAFANQVVSYLEHSCKMVHWQPIDDSLDNFAEARLRWAVALQIFWFLEKASA